MTSGNLKSNISMGNDVQTRLAARAQDLIGNDPEIRAASPDAMALQFLREECHTSIDLMAAMARVYGSRPCLGERLSGEPFKTITYTELWQEVTALATGLHSLKLATYQSMVAICGFGSVHWLVADFACQYLGAVSVPLQTNLVCDDLEAIIRNADVTCVVCSAAQLGALAQALQHGSEVKSIVIMDDVEDPVGGVVDHRRNLQSQYTIYTLQEVIQAGKASTVRPRAQPGSDGVSTNPLLTLVYTSGSTGLPKGAMYHENILLQHWRAALDGDLPLVPSITVSYLPLNHVAGRSLVMQTLVRGGVTYFTQKSDMSSLFHDIRTVRPTWLMLIPRLSEMIYQLYQNDLEERLAASPRRSRKVLERQALQNLRKHLLGDRLLYGITSTAPTAPEIATFLQSCFEIALFDIYGATESGFVTLNNRLVHNRVREFKLVDVPELNYFSTDSPFPRGELRIKSSTAVQGYYKNPQASRALYDDDGFLQTGDIVEARGPDEFVWVDRQHNVLKLSQGEFVSISRLETMFVANSPYIEQIYIYGDSRRSYLVAVVVPNKQAVEARRPPLDGPTLRSLIRAEIDRVGATAKVPGYEIPRNFVLSEAVFSRENGLLTESNKLSRPRLKKRFLTELEALYDVSGGAAATPTVISDHSPTIDRVMQAVRTAVGIKAMDVHQSYVSLGGDSLGAVRLNQLIKKAWDVNVPVAFLLDPSNTVETIACRVDLLRQSSSTSRLFTTIHGPDAGEIRRQDLQVQKFLAPLCDSMAERPAATAAPDAGRSVLLTGANGFLGRHLLLNLLEQLPSKGGAVTCLVRAHSDAHALERLQASYGPGPARHQLQRLATDGRLRVLAADLMLPQFGLNKTAYAELCETTDRIFHNGALVNHTLSYEQLFEPNVLGTAEVMLLALRRRLKPINFISSVAVAGGLRQCGPILEDTRAAALWDKRPNSGGYAAGYGTSKWACEILLDQLHESYSVPVTIFRCGMVLPHRKLLGQINTSDFFTRLLYSLAKTQLAPASFYAQSRQANAHFDGVPVDFVAEAIVSLGLQPDPSNDIFHVVNPHHDDGISLDTLVDWLETAGHTLHRVADYSKWYEQFGKALKSMVPREQARSALPILHQWAQPETDSVAYDATAFRRKVRECTSCSDVPRLNEAFLHQCLQHMIYLGLMAAPDPQHQATDSRRQPAIL